MVLHVHFSQFLLSSELPRMFSHFLNFCVVHQDLVGQVDNQKRVQEYSYPLVYFAAFLIRGWGFLELEVI